MGPEDLQAILRQLTPPRHPSLWEGTVVMDDAGGVYLEAGQLLFQSVDVIAPPCDDPERYGRIAAANALSDLYARGARPFSALHILAYPPDRIPPQFVARILAGAQTVLLAAGAAPLGGHTVKDTQVMYGLAVSGIAAVDRVVPLNRMQEGDCLVLTKPLGTGVIIEAMKADRVSETQAEPVFFGMERLNRRAAELMVEFAAHAATDVTGYGLAGHLLHMVRTANVSVEIDLNRLPIYAPAYAEFRSGRAAGAASANRKYTVAYLDWQVPEAYRPVWNAVIHDPQTSGGLLIALPEARWSAFMERMQQEQEACWTIGRAVKARGAPRIVVRARDTTAEVVS